MFITEQMGLTKWDLPGDDFSHTELSDNFLKLDAHDHVPSGDLSPGNGYEIPAGGIANLAVTSEKIASGAVTVSKIASGAISSAGIANATFAEAKLASPNTGVWQNLWHAGGSSINTFYPNTPVWLQPSEGFKATNSQYGAYIPCFTPQPAAERILSGKTTQVRMMGVFRNNGVVATGITFTLSMQRVTSGATAGSMTLAPAGSAISIAWTAPAINSTTVVRGTAVEFATAFPIDNASYAAQMNYNGTYPANFTASVDLYIQMRYV